MASNIKLLSFQRQNSAKQYQSPSTIHSQISINFIVLTFNKKLGFIDKHIKEQLKQRDDIGYTKCNKISAFNYALEKCPIGVPVYCIIDQQIGQDLMKAFVNNRQTIQNRSLFSLALFLQNMEDINKQYFQIEGLDLITSESQKIIDYTNDALKLRKNLTYQASTSSIASNDVKDIEYRFSKNQKKLQHIKDANIAPDQSQKIYKQEIGPEFSHNNVYPKQKKTGFSFNSKQISSPEKWSNTKQTYTRIQKN